MPVIPSEPVGYIVAGLAIIGLMVLILPFKVKIIEENLEPFFLVMGILSVTVSGLWSIELIKSALKSPLVIGNLPIGIFQVVLLFGILVYYFNKPFYKAMVGLAGKLGPKLFVFLLIMVAALLSSIISVIVTATILAEIAAALPIDKQDKVKLIVVTCFAVALGAVLTPIGEPLSTIMVLKLSGAPYHAGFTFPLITFGKYVIPGVTAIALFGAFYCGRGMVFKSKDSQATYSEPLRGVIMRAVKVFAFVAALTLLGEGLRPIVDWYFSKIPAMALYWINAISAVLDNATLAAIEIDPSLSLAQISGIIMGLSIAGGMLIPGNIPNIVAAVRLRISMREWAVIGLPLGLAIMAIYFLILFVGLR